MRKKVSIVKCEDYLPENVFASVKRAVDLLELDLKQVVKDSMNILIKPNLCNNSKPEDAITTHPEVIRALLLLLKEYKGRILIGDNSVGRDDPKNLDVVYKTCGIDDIIEEFGYEKNYLNNHVRKYSCVVDGKKAGVYLSEPIVDTSFIINVPKFKTHSLMTFTGAIKNLYGMIPGNTKRLLHVEFPDTKQFALLLVQLYNLLKPKLNVMDAVVGIEGDGPSRSGKKRKIGYILASEDALALDIVASQLMGIDAMQVPTNSYAARYYNIKNLDNYVQILGESISNCVLPDFLLPATAMENDSLTKKMFSLSTPKLHIDSDKCTMCMMCMKNCPKKAVSRLPDSRLKIDSEQCISCMICMELCPCAAIQSQLPPIYKQLRALRNKNS